jgi:glycosyltransferase involved in cell wall biosynthesis
LRASVILAAYGQPGTLALALAAFTHQATRDFEIVVADDGSPEGYGETLAAYAARFQEPIQHVRQDDRGFRKTRILNRAVSVARAPCLVFADFDCLPHPRFVEDHLRHVAPGTAVSGRRVHVERSALADEAGILARGVGLGPLRLVLLALRGQARVIEHGIPLPFLAEASQERIFGSNFSILREDLVRVNGFNEEYEAPGIGEDTDLDLRLKKVGTKVRVFRNRMIQYHLAHPSPRYDTPSNMAILERARAASSGRAPVGLSEIVAGDFERREYGGETPGGASARGRPPVASN